MTKTKADMKKKWKKRKPTQPSRGMGEPPVTAAFDRAGRRVDFDPTLLPAGRMSDALVALVEHLAPWPPAPSELEEFHGWLILAGVVWNATLPGRDVSPIERAEASGDWSRLGLAGAELARVVDGLAARRREKYGADRREVHGVSVRVEAGEAKVNVISAMFVAGGKRAAR